MEYTDTFAKKLVDQMTLDQKVGAVLTLGFAGVVPKPYIYDFIEKYHCGGLRLRYAHLRQLCGPQKR